ncbi:hypothetical protein COA19_03260 [Bacillus thuringiensis]|uniref:hypothetical protein n=1 Tax=Bacillus thuringiensis TaxID=1428 RepID=UPI000BFB1CB9|nr:hypothetical protein [Bacillus thuringiensis]PGQ42454.1 hypothetical protein COA19_03260 [Bacillus thuringiensis]PGW84183.1 hypothetical protein COE21_00935 [Bacillus thuringiensis]
MFSRATLVDVFSLFSNQTHTVLDKFFFKYGIEEHTISASNKENKALAAVRYLIDNPDSKGILGGNMAFEMVEEILGLYVENDYYYDDESGEFNGYPKLKRLLLKDGFVIRDRQLVRMVDSTIDYVENEGLLLKLLDKYNYSIAKGHYTQAVNAFTRGDWAACNSQIRTFVEELLCKIAEDITGNTFVNSHSARTALSQSSPKLFYPELNEWLNDGKGYFETFWKRLHPQGSHPGLSDENDSMFRLNIVQISILEILRRYDEYKMVLHP